MLRYTHVLACVLLLQGAVFAERRGCENPETVSLRPSARPTSELQARMRLWAQLYWKEMAPVRDQWSLVVLMPSRVGISAGAASASARAIVSVPRPP